MITRQAKLTAEQYNNIAAIETSVQYHTNRHTAVALEGRKILDAIDALYRARDEIMDKAYKDACIDGNSVQHISIGKDPEGGGIITVQCAEPIPVPMPVSEPAKSNGTTVTSEPTPP
jgi:hypothetical protein